MIYGSLYNEVRYRQVRHYDPSDVQLSRMQQNVSQCCLKVARYMEIIIQNKYEIFTSENLTSVSAEGEIQNSTFCER